MARTDTLSRSGLVLSAGLVLALAASLAGCATYANAPGPESTPAVEDPNRRNPAAVVAQALRTIQTRYPIPGEFAVQFPTGTNDETASRALAGMGEGARRTGPGTAGLPTYYIGRVWIRSGFAKVDILRPVVELGPDASGDLRHRPYTVWMEGGLEPWRTTRVQTWAIGSMPLPTEGGDVPRRTVGSAGLVGETDTYNSAASVPAPAQNAEPDPAPRQRSAPATREAGDRPSDVRVFRP